MLADLVLVFDGPGGFEEYLAICRVSISYIKCIEGWILDKEVRHRKLGDKTASFLCTRWEAAHGFQAYLLMLSKLSPQFLSSEERSVAGEQHLLCFAR